MAASKDQRLWSELSRAALQAPGVEFDTTPDPVTEERPQTTVVFYGTRAETPKLRKPLRPILPLTALYRLSPKEGAMSTTNQARPIELWTLSEKVSAVAVFFRLAAMLGLKLREQELEWFLWNPMACTGKDSEFSQLGSKARESGIIDSKTKKTEFRKALCFITGVAQHPDNLKRIWKVNFPLVTPYETAKGWQPLEQIWKHLSEARLAVVRKSFEFPAPSTLAPELLAALEGLEGIRFEAEPAKADAEPEQTEDSVPVENTGAAAGDANKELAHIHLPSAPDLPAPVTDSVPDIELVLRGTGHKPDDKPRPTIRIDRSKMTLPELPEMPEPEALPDLLAESLPEPKKPVPKPRAPLPAPSLPPKTGVKRKLSLPQKVFVLFAVCVLAVSLGRAGALYFRGLAKPAKPANPASEPDNTHTTQTSNEKKGDIPPQQVREEKKAPPAEKVPPTKPRKGLKVDSRDFDDSIAEIRREPWVVELLPKLGELSWNQAYALAGDKLPGGVWSKPAQEQENAEEDFIAFAAFSAHCGRKIDSDWIPSVKDVYVWMMLRRLCLYKAGEAKPFIKADEFDDAEIHDIRVAKLSKQFFSTDGTLPSEGFVKARDKFNRLIAAYRKKALSE